MNLFALNEITDAWKAISVENLEGKFSRQIFLKSSTDIKASVDIAKNLKSVDFIFKKKFITSKKISFKETKGINVLIEGDKNFPDRLILSIYLKNSFFLDIYLKLIDKIINDLQLFNDDNIKFVNINKHLINWRKCFESENYEGLSLEEQIGLIGELSQLQKIIDKGISLENSLTYWQGPEQALHDFKHPKFTVEVKTTTNKKKEIRVNNIEQFDYEFHNNLYLCCAIIDRGINGLNLVEHIENFKKKNFERDNLILIFENKLSSMGYLDIHKDFYLEKFNLIEIIYFKIEKGFPCILPSQINENIRKLEYNIDLTGCDNFLTDDSFLIN